MANINAKTTTNANVNTKNHSSIWGMQKETAFRSMPEGGYKLSLKKIEEVHAKNGDIYIKFSGSAVNAKTDELFSNAYFMQKCIDNAMNFIEPILTQLEVQTLDEAVGVLPKDIYILNSVNTEGYMNWTAVKSVYDEYMM